jgi:hypothetical protein
MPRFQTEPPNPVPDSGVSDTDLLCRPVDRGASLNHPAKAIRIDFAVRRVDVVTNWLQPVLLEVIADRRRILAGQGADLVQ